MSRATTIYALHKEVLNLTSENGFVGAQGAGYRTTNHALHLKPFILTPKAISRIPAKGSLTE